MCVTLFTMLNAPLEDERVDEWEVRGGRKKEEEGGRKKEEKGGGGKRGRVEGSV